MLKQLLDDPAPLVRYAEEGSTDAELGDVFGISGEDLAKHFDAPLRKARAELRRRIRRAMLAAAEKRDAEPAALEYLANTYLSGGKNEKASDPG